MFNNAKPSQVNSALMVLFEEMKGNGRIKDDVNIPFLISLFDRDFCHEKIRLLFHDIIEKEAMFFTQMLPNTPNGKNDE